MQPQPIPFTPKPGALLGSQATVGTPGSGSFGDLDNFRCPLENEHKNLQESPSLGLGLLSSSPDPDRAVGEASYPAPLGRAEGSRMLQWGGEVVRDSLELRGENI